jgi:tRNA(fMet)-specific endonuclease VapC
VLLLDTDVMVDVLRGYEPAVEWLSLLTDEAPALPGLVVLELMDGCRSTMEMKRLVKRVKPFRIYWPSAADCDRALAEFANGRLTHGLSIMDVLIAECAVGLNATLCTFNTKHFKSITQLRTRQPVRKESCSLTC